VYKIALHVRYNIKCELKVPKIESCFAKVELKVKPVDDMPVKQLSPHKLT